MRSIVVLAWCLRGGAGGVAVANPRDMQSSTILALNHFSSGELSHSQAAYYRMWVPLTIDLVKIVRVNLRGEADVSVSVQLLRSQGNNTWQLHGTGPQELELRTAELCSTVNRPNRPAVHNGCFMFLNVVPRSPGAVQYQLGVLDVHDPFGHGCAPGCTDSDLSSPECNVRCNTSACGYDHGACLSTPVVSVKEDDCSVGCSSSWLEDGYCDEACFTVECDWDGSDCELSDVNVCAEGCLPEFLGDGECDESCNYDECSWDGYDCEPRSLECFWQDDGSDYRGIVNHTLSGLPCQMWTRQQPQQHVVTSERYPNAGLGAHSYCRNPDGKAWPWCYTREASIRWEVCELRLPPDLDCRSVARQVRVQHLNQVSSEQRAGEPQESRRSQCKQACAGTWEQLHRGDCSASCSVTRGEPADACIDEVDDCLGRHEEWQRLLLVVSLAVFGTAVFVFALLMHIGRWRAKNPQHEFGLSDGGDYASSPSMHYTGLLATTPASMLKAVEIVDIVE
mmetsp:Transcript_1909/g.3070  ORF Transcript_1909/g.3070 Transcript_1909/m.3070 type:complete len:508 (-) Transcript_1909:156-1679(-)